MNDRGKTSTGATAAQGPCPHHWVIEPPNGPTSMGVCKTCGARKEFSNELPAAEARPPRSDDREAVAAGQRRRRE